MPDSQSLKSFLQQVFGRRRKAIEPVRTAPLPEEQLTTVDDGAVPIEPVQLLVGSGQSVGKERDHNEDTLFVMTAALSGQEETIPFGIFIVADGMGGYQHGEIASRAAARAVAAELIKKLIVPYYNVWPDVQNEPIQEILRDGVHLAQQAVTKLAPGGGTTLTVALLMGDQVTFTHVGDSRAYFIYPDGRAQAVTRDHSLVRRLQELGQLTEDEAAVHPQRNVLYRAIGQAEPVDPDISTYPMPRPGHLMLCSDGLWNMVPEAEIVRIVRDAKTHTEACQRLVQAANDAGGPDNISVILVSSSA